MTKMKGYLGEIRRPDDWCDYLQWQRDHVFIQGPSAICQFSNEYVIPLAKCKSPTGALVEAFTLAAHLVESEPNAYPSVVVKQFLDLIRAPNKLPHDLSRMFEELWQTFEIRLRATPEREPSEQS